MPFPPSFSPEQLKKLSQENDAWHGQRPVVADPEDLAFARAAAQAWLPAVLKAIDEAGVPMPPPTGF